MAKLNKKARRKQKQKQKKKAHNISKSRTLLSPALVGQNGINWSDGDCLHSCKPDESAFLTSSLVSVSAQMQNPGMFKALMGSLGSNLVRMQTKEKAKSSFNAMQTSVLNMSNDVRGDLSHVVDGLEQEFGQSDRSSTVASMLKDPSNIELIDDIVSDCASVTTKYVYSHKDPHLLWSYAGSDPLCTIATDFLASAPENFSFEFNTGGKENKAIVLFSKQEDYWRVTVNLYDSVIDSYFPAYVVLLSDQYEKSRKVAYSAFYVMTKYSLLGKDAVNVAHSFISDVLDTSVTNIAVTSLNILANALFALSNISMKPVTPSDGDSSGKNHNPGSGRDFVSIDHNTEVLYSRKGQGKGKSHARPDEHERKQHRRRYRDDSGNVVKVVEIGQTTVNKGFKKVG